MKTLQITLLLLFVSFGSFAQDYQIDQKRKSLLSNEYVREAKANILLIALDYKSDTTVFFEKIKDNALQAVKNDTLILFSTGGMGLNSREGVGNYDSITLTHSFLYVDITTDCLTTFNFVRAKGIYNSTIWKELKVRNGENWKKDIQNKIDSVKSNQSKKE
ncbi:hypothetical protein WAF17_19645 [Bernardetia sp. ABR2-2B]|uniref:hypothetical protein n=1 Tax=Bernardetia sp. ABR2-2B TaxID=3127472 RepID=UPI0030D04994